MEHGVWEVGVFQDLCWLVDLVPGLFVWVDFPSPVESRRGMELEGSQEVGVFQGLGWLVYLGIGMLVRLWCLYLAGSRRFLLSFPFYLASDRSWLFGENP